MENIDKENIQKILKNTDKFYLVFSGKNLKIIGHSDFNFLNINEYDLLTGNFKEIIRNNFGEYLLKSKRTLNLKFQVTYKKNIDDTSNILIGLYYEDYEYKKNSTNFLSKDNQVVTKLKSIIQPDENIKLARISYTATPSSFRVSKVFCQHTDEKYLSYYIKGENVKKELQSFMQEFSDKFLFGRWFRKDYGELVYHAPSNFVEWNHFSRKAISCVYTKNLDF